MKGTLLPFIIHCQSDPTYCHVLPMYQLVCPSINVAELFVGNHRGHVFIWGFSNIRHIFLIWTFFFEKDIFCWLPLSAAIFFAAIFLYGSARTAINGWMGSSWVGGRPCSMGYSPGRCGERNNTYPGWESERMGFLAGLVLHTCTANTRARLGPGRWEEVAYPGW